MKIAIIGSHQYIGKMCMHKLEMEQQGHEVRLPSLDSHPEYNELQIFATNRDLIKWADRVDIFWDQRSFGFCFDFGMVFMAEKPIKIIYMESKTFRAGIEQYESSKEEPVEEVKEIQWEYPRAKNT